MKRFFKICLIFLLGLLIMIGVNGCMLENKAQLAEITKEKALKYLNENYDDNFKPVSFSARNWARNYESIYFLSEKFENRGVEVRLFENGEISDNYFKLYMENDAIKYFADMVNKYDSNAIVKVIFSSEMFPSSLKKGMNFSTYISSGQAELSLYFIFNEDIPKSEKYSITSDVALNKIFGSCWFLQSDNIDNLRSQTVDEIFSDESNIVHRTQIYYIDKNYSICE